MNAYKKRVLALDVGERRIGVAVSDPLGLTASYYDRAIDGGTEVCYTPRRLGPGMSISAGAGMISGMLGIGGGAVQVPAMNAIMQVPVKAATAAFAQDASSSADAAPVPVETRKAPSAAERTASSTPGPGWMTSATRPPVARSCGPRAWR